MSRYSATLRASWLALSIAGCGNAPPNVAVSIMPDGGADAPTSPQVCRFAPTSVPNGFPCGCDRDCQSNALCSTEMESGEPGGRCIAYCDAAMRGPCPAKSRCIVFGKLPLGMCMVECSTNADCPPRNYCQTDEHVCLPMCTTDADCMDERLCDPYSAGCVTSSSTGGGVAARCVNDKDCRSQFCSEVTKRCENSCAVGKAACPEGSLCVPRSPGNGVGTCRPACLGDGTCTDAAMQCRPTAEPAGHACFDPEEDRCMGRHVGDTDGLNCDCPSDCKFDSQCYRESDTGDPFGDCTTPCTLGGNECGPGRECSATMAGGPGFCRLKCTVDADCPKGDLCNSSGRCGPLCQGPEDCGGKQCNLYSGYCEATPTTGLPMGARCINGQQCRSKICGNGYCTGHCAESRQVCPDGTVCLSSSETSARTAGFCLPACDSDADCTAAGTQCSEIAGLPPFCL